MCSTRRKRARTFGCPLLCTGASDSTSTFPTSLSFPTARATVFTFPSGQSPNSHISAPSSRMRRFSTQISSCLGLPPSLTHATSTSSAFTTRWSGLDSLFPDGLKSTRAPISLISQQKLWSTRTWWICSLTKLISWRFSLSTMSFRLEMCLKTCCLRFHITNSQRKTKFSLWQLWNIAIIRLSMNQNWQEIPNSLIMLLSNTPRCLILS